MRSPYVLEVRSVNRSGLQLGLLAHRGVVAKHAERRDVA